MVVVIIAILASVILVETSSAVKDSKISNLKMNARTLRDQIARYKWDHEEHLPTGSNNLHQLTSSTDVTGALTAGPGYPFGPYLGILPPNPFTDSSKVRLDTGSAGTPPTPSGASDAGWIYRAATGEIWADNSDLINF